MSKVVAKFSVSSKEEFGHADYLTGKPMLDGGKVKLSAVYAPDDTNHENHQFWTATPQGSIEMTINNLEALPTFKPGRVCYVTFDFQDAD
jgi:hypothetical protein